MKVIRPIQKIQYLHNRVQERISRGNGKRNSIKNNSRTIVRTKEIELPDWKSLSKAPKSEWKYIYTKTHLEFQNDGCEQILSKLSESKKFTYKGLKIKMASDFLMWKRTNKTKH